MANRFSYWSAFALLLVAGILIFGEHVSAINCDNDLIGVVTKCQKYVVKQGGMIKPSPECCEVVKKVNVPCACSHVTVQIEELISMEKVFYVANSCGKKVPPGTKCGSYTVPK